MGLKMEQWNEESLATAMANANKSDRTILREKDPVETKNAVKSEKTPKKQGRPTGSKNKKTHQSKKPKAEKTR